MPTRARSRSGVPRGDGVQALDLVVQHGRGEVAVHGALELRARGPGVPRPSTTTTAKPWSANHWLVRCAPRAATTRWACGPP